MLELLCQILQTDSVHEVQQWLVSAGDRGIPLYGVCTILTQPDCVPRTSLDV